jgi:Flp pilus assembly secretin CpaC
MWKRAGTAVTASVLTALIVLPRGAAAADMAVPAARDLSTDGAIIAREAERIGVTLDFARVMAFKQPVRTIIIGNPGIVDGTLSDDRTIVLTGKAIGSTNMIILGEGGAEIANVAVSVFANGNQMTTIYLGAEKKVFSCAGSCRPVPAADDKK